MPPARDPRRAAREAFERADYERAAAACRELLAANPEDVEARRLLGRAALARQRPLEAETWLREAAARAPLDASLVLDLAHALGERRRPADAEALLAAADARGLRTPSLLAELGFLRLGLARLEGARAAFETALELDSRCGEAFRGLALAGALNPGEPGRARAERLFAEAAAPVQARASIGYALGECALREGDGERLAAVLRQASALALASAPPRRQSELERCVRARRAFTSAIVHSAPRGRLPPFTPIFVIAPPRAGQAVVARLLDATPDVFVGGELGLIRGPVLAALTARTGRPWPAGLDALTSEALTAAGEEYVSRIRDLAPSASIVIDRSPGLGSYVGLIALMFPNTRFVRVRREPMETGFAAYRTRFARPALHLCDLAAIGAHLRAEAALWRHWRALALAPMLELELDAVLADPAATAAALATHCGLSAPPRVAVLPLERPSRRWRLCEGALAPLRKLAQAIRDAEGEPANATKTR